MHTAIVAMDEAFTKEYLRQGITGPQLQLCRYPSLLLYS